MKRALLALLALACAAGEAGAHARSISHSRWRLGERGATVEVRLARRDLAVRGVVDPATHAAERLTIASDGTPCRPGPARTLPSAEGWLRLGWDVTCDGPPDRIDNHLFVEGPGARLHFARVERPGGAPIQRVFGPADVSLRLPRPGGDPAAEAPAASIGRYVALGVEHIVTGWDHLAFLAGLIVLAASLGDVLVLATGFTVAHSVTLALSVLGVARPDGPAVEALIGFSILLVAVENVWLVAGRGRTVPAALLALLVALGVLRAAGYGGITLLTLAGLAVFTAAHFGLLAIGRHPARLRAAVAFGFGLVHGFGFAGILHEAALPPGAVVPALVGFNAGVELGQVGAIALAWPVLVVVRRLGRALVVEAVSAGLAGLGTLWFVGRAFG